MEKITHQEILDITQYELERPNWRPKMMALKDRRRIRVGDHLTFLFENRETVRYQIQEMMRIERLVKPAEIAHEVKTYNELIPEPDELSATLLIEFETPELRAVWLRRLLGLEDHLWMETNGGERAQARFDTRQISTDRISSVQYVKFPLSHSQAERFAQGARIIADHPAYSYTAELTTEQLQELSQDLK